ncbi:MAG: SDR family NAD(P)-dependent oxidoreductase [Clostridia bacterium]|nr:SDR family NAD(P)-dependent oxidoreductase [Clostridia bacterium]
MSCQTWIRKHTAPLTGKTVAISGSTGGLGQALCRRLAGLGADLVLLDRNKERAAALQDELRQKFAVRVEYIPLDLENMGAVLAAADRLADKPPHVLILNAGAYAIPRHLCDTGYDNVFQINYLAPYVLTRRLLPALNQNGGHVVAVGSIAHTYSKTDPADIDFRTRRQASLAYGHAKRRLTFSLYDLFRGQTATLAVTHPGIAFTNITNHYPKVIFALIKHPMKVLFMKPKKACLSILRGVFDPCGEREWIGPWLFHVWGLPKKTALATVSREEQAAIAADADRLYAEITEKYAVKKE